MSAVRRTALVGAVAILFSGLVVLGTTTQASAYGSYTPPNGVKINNPLRSDQRWRIFNTIINTIRSVPPGGKIRIASWNIRSDSAVRALVRAHRRGVSVRVLMDYGNDDPTRLPNPGFNWMRSQLRKDNNSARKPDMKSWARVCHASCESDHGMMHSKFFLFSRSGKARYIVMHGSANLTRVAAVDQWNNLYTIHNKPIFDYMIGRFYQMAPDHFWARPTKYQGWRNIKIWNFPWAAPFTGDPIINQLDKVRCGGVSGGTGYKGHTLIRIAQTVIGDRRGIAIAKKLAQLRGRGCKVRLVFTLLNPTARKILDDAGVWRHIVAKDPDQDYVYDKYLHLKAMTISGNWNGYSNARVAFDGSHNWNSMSLRSDETFAQVNFRGAFKAYSTFVDYYLYHPLPVRTPPTNSTERSSINQFAKVQVD